MENIMITQRMVDDAREAEISSFKDSEKCEYENHFKSPWISIEDDLPCNHDDMVTVDDCHKIKFTSKVLVMNKYGDICDDFMRKYLDGE